MTEDKSENSSAGESLKMLPISARFPVMSKCNQGRGLGLLHSFIVHKLMIVDFGQYNVAKSRSQSGNIEQPRSKRRPRIRIA